MPTSAENRIYAVHTDASGKISLEPVWTQSTSPGDGANHTHLVPITVDNRVVLIAYDKATQSTSAYAMIPGGSWMQPIESRIDLTGGPWDHLDSFVFGNDTYLMTYRADHGEFAVCKVSNDLSASPPFKFGWARNWPTKGFTTVAPFASLGAQYVLGYDFEHGTVAIYSLTTITSAPGGTPALLAQNAWYHTWAKGWTRFAFFRLGGSNFFFKINLAKLNVNIDHIQDNPAAGTVEVGSYLQSQLPDAEAIDVAAKIPWAYEEPYLLTYIASTGKTEVFHIHADCQGWTRLYSGTTVTSARLVIPYRIGDTSYVLFYGGTGSADLGTATGDSESASPRLPVPPDSVRVWRGYALDRTQRESFVQNLRSTFIPITAQVMGKLGLTAYLPAIVPADRVASVPDEIALVFYRSQAEYQQNANDTTVGRAYQKLHGSLFKVGAGQPTAPASASAFPIPLRDVCISGQPYYLIPEAADWYEGTSDVFVGVYEADSAGLATAVVKAANALQAKHPPELDGCILVVTENVFICWRHWKATASTDPWDIGVPLRRVLWTNVRYVNVDPSEYARSPGVTADVGDFVNVHFARR
jgi:hypothetical protein